MFKNRIDAGVQLAEKLKQFVKKKHTVVVGLTRGGVVVGFAVAKVLNLPFVPLIVKKLPSPTSPELAIGALSQDGDVFWDREILEYLEIGENEKKEILERKRKEIKSQARTLGISSQEEFSSKTIILVDDGVATGATAIAASLTLRRKKALKIILATPLIAQDTKEKLKKYFDETITILTPSKMVSVGEFYNEFEQVDDNVVKNILDQS